MLTLKMLHVFYFEISLQASLLTQSPFLWTMPISAEPDRSRSITHGDTTLRLRSDSPETCLLLHKVSTEVAAHMRLSDTDVTQLGLTHKCLKLCTQRPLLSARSVT